MRVLIDRKSFLASLKAISKITPKRSPKPILQTIRLTFRPGDSTLESNDLEVATRCRLLGVKVDTTGSVCIDPRTLADALDSLPDDDVSIRLNDESAMVVSGQSSERTIATQPDADHPGFPEANGAYPHGGLTIESDRLASAIKAALPCTDPDSTRYSLGGICFDLSRYHLFIVGTDGRRMAIARVDAQESADWQSPESGQWVCPQDAAKFVSSLGSKHDRVTFSWETVPTTGATCARFEIGQWEVWSRPMEGRFPNYRAVLPSGYENRYTVDHAELRAIAEAAKKSAGKDESRCVDLTFQHGRLSASRPGYSGQSSACSGSPDAATITLDSGYLLDMTRSIGNAKRSAGEIAVELIDWKSATVWRYDGPSLDLTYAIMPLHRGDPEPKPAETPEESPAIETESADDNESVWHTESIVSDPPKPADPEPEPEPEPIDLATVETIIDGRLTERITDRIDTESAVCWAVSMVPMLALPAPEPVRPDPTRKDRIGKVLKRLHAERKAMASAGPIALAGPIGHDGADTMPTRPSPAQSGRGFVLLGPPTRPADPPTRPDRPEPRITFDRPLPWSPVSIGPDPEPTVKTVPPAVVPSRVAIRVPVTGPRGSVTDYGVTVIDRRAGRYLIESPRGDAYEVSEFGGDVPTCECPAYRHQSEDVSTPTCKHVRALIAVGLLEPATMPSPAPDVCPPAGASRLMSAETESLAPVCGGAPDDSTTEPCPVSIGDRVEYLAEPLHHYLPKPIATVQSTRFGIYSDGSGEPEWHVTIFSDETGRTVETAARHVRLMSAEPEEPTMPEAALIDAADTTTWGDDTIHVPDEPLPPGRIYGARRWKDLARHIKAATGFRPCSLTFRSHVATYHVETDAATDWTEGPDTGRVPIPRITWTRDGFPDRRTLRDVALCLKIAYLAAIVPTDDLPEPQRCDACAAPTDNVSPDGPILCDGCA